MEAECLYLLGVQYERARNYDIAKTYYMLAIKGGNLHAVGGLGRYYKSVEKNYDVMKTYYLLAIKYGNTVSMNNLGHYYHTIEKNYDEMKKYYMMAITRGYVTSMYNLGYYYQTIEKNYEEMKKYYLMAIVRGDPGSMNNLGIYYWHDEKNNELSKKYLLMAFPHPESIKTLRTLIENNPELFRDDIKNKSITINQLCLIYRNNTKLLEYLGMTYAKYRYPYALELMDELDKIIFGNVCIAECPICWESKKCGHYPCDERHKVCRECYWKSPNKCYYNCK